MPRLKTGFRNQNTCLYSKNMTRVDPRTCQITVYGRELILILFSILFSVSVKTAEEGLYLEHNKRVWFSLRYLQCLGDSGACLACVGSPVAGAAPLWGP